jgi:sulfur relay protein TusD/DsrE
MKILLIVNNSPWGSTLGLTALRFARAAITEGMSLSAVFFREDGVYHALSGRATDAGTPELSNAWCALAQQSSAELLLCSASSQRRLAEAPGSGFREAGLAEMLELMTVSDRVVTF